MGPRLRGDDAEDGAASANISQFKFQTAKRPRSRAAARVGLLVFLPSFEGRRSAERRALVVKMRPSDAPSRDFFVPGTGSSGAGASKLAIQAGFRPPFACPVQPLKAEPRSGLGRLPKAPRVHACEAWPRAPHPTGSGYPSPVKLSLCPTSVTPLEAPLIGQDARISEVLGAGIGIHSQVRERQFAARVPGACSVLCGAERNPGCRFAHPGYELLRAASRPGHEGGC